MTILDFICNWIAGVMCDSDVPCDYLPDVDCMCYNICDYDRPQPQCWKRYFATRFNNEELYK